MIYTIDIHGTIFSTEASDIERGGLKMEMERINDDTIRVVVGSDDLADRGIKILDLLGNQKQIESFFYSILEEVDKDHQFRDTDAVTFQVLPNADGLELFISKTNPINKEDSSDEIKKGELDDPLIKMLRDSGVDVVDDGTINHQSEEDEHSTNDPFAPHYLVKILKFNNFDDFVALSKVVDIENGLANLYLYDGQYYIELRLPTDSDVDLQVSDVLAIVSEYAKTTSITSEVLSEHGKLVISPNAFMIGRKYF